jgi:hypothetical protein
MSEEPAMYHSYLLRLWRTSSQSNAVWRASLESAQSGERRVFADLESLFAFLEAQTGADAPRDTRPPSSEP